jgi:dienelactone hydrolase
MRRCYWVATGLALVMTLMLGNRVSAAEPSEDDPDQDGGRRVGLTSTMAECLVVNAGTVDSTSATVHLEWEGRVDQAFLVLSAAGSEAGHSIYVNGQLVGSAPVQPGDQACQAGLAIGIPIPAGVLVNGENVIVLTNDADINDGWTAANLYLEIRGDLSLLPAVRSEDASPTPLPPEIGATAVVSGYVRLTSSYDGVEHLVWYQIPEGYAGGSPVPLLVGVHGWSGTGEDMINFMGGSVNERGWLFVAPNMHGRFYLDGKRALAWPGAQHDIIDAVEYMRFHYDVDTSRIYITGGSMGGQTTTVMGAKYPDVFAAAAGWSGFTDLTDWYNELAALRQYYMLGQMRREIDPSCDPDIDQDFDQGCGTPAVELFEYQCRSAIEMPQNSRLMPLHMWHNQADQLVPVHHAHDLADAINRWTPLIPVTVTTVITAGCTDAHKHCYNPDHDEVLDYLAGFTLSSQPPASVTIRTDASKPYYWLNVAQTGGDHWSEVQASYDLASATVSAVISDTQPLTVALNLGSTPTMGRIVERPGMGLPATTYLVSGGGNYELEDYTSGCLTTTLTTTGLSTMKISAVKVGVSAEPSMVSGGRAATSTITTFVEDQLSNPVPDGTTIELSTTEGAFVNGISTYSTTTVGGRAATVLSLGPNADLAKIIANVGSVTGSTSVDVIHPAIDMLVTPNQVVTYTGRTVTYTYQITNTGDITLTDVTVTDDQGTPEDNSDDLTVCANITMVVGAAVSCGRNVTPTQTMTSTAVVTGQDPLGNEVTERDSFTVKIISAYAYLPIVIR